MVSRSCLVIHVEWSTNNNMKSFTSVIYVTLIVVKHLSVQRKVVSGKIGTKFYPQLKIV